MPASSQDRRRALGAMGGIALLPLWGAGCAGAPPAVAPMPAPVPPRPPMPALSRDAAYRFVNRLSWGATDAELARCVELGPESYLRAQLAARPGALPDAVQAQIDAMSLRQQSPAERYERAESLRKASQTAATEDERKAANEAFQREMTRQAREAASRLLLRTLYAPSQLHEQMSWFWFNHFNVHQYKHQLRVLIADYEERALRPHALGSFRALLAAATLDPAMLQYLDNAQNAAQRLNENHARELLELHTLGVDGGYTQKDVQELARVLTGHGVNFGDTTPRLRPEYQPLYRRSGFYEFNPARHDFGDKQLLGRMIRGRGAAELDEVFDLLARHPATARFMSRKMAQYLLADDPPPELVERMARAFDGGHIGAALGVLASSEAFAAAGPGKFKDPMHFVTSAVRAAYGERVVLSTAPMQNWLNAMGEGLYNRQTPDGYPQRAEAWNGSGQLATRFDIARTIGSGSAGLFKGTDATAGREQAAFPQLSRPIFHQVVAPMLGEATRTALDGAASPQEWNTFVLSSPEFMVR